MKTGFICLALAVSLCTPFGAASADAPPSPLDDARAAALERGAKDEPPLFSELKAVKKDEAALGRMKLKARQCVVVAAAGTRDVADVLLSIKKTDGAWISESAQGPAATLRYCGGDKDERIVMRARVRGVATKLGLSAFALAQDAEKSGEAKEAPVANAPEPEKAKPDTRTLRQRLSRLAEKNGAPLSSPMAPAREEDVSPKDPRTREVSLTAGFCYRVHVAVPEGIRNLTLSLKDAAGKELAPKESAAADMTYPKDVAFCPSASANYQLTLHATEGAGVLLWQLHGGPNQARVYAFPVGGKEEGLLARRLRALQPKTGEGKPAVMNIRQGHLKTSEELEAFFNAESGSCYVAIAVGAPSLRSLDIELTDQRGNAVASAPDRGNQASARACAQVPGQWRVRARAFKGYGDVAIQVFGGQ